ncbi:MAG: glutamate--tRNA ligase [Polyangiaceae bacterium]|nr:glutamate--tRNA ligase [Polyangiaceae bacterium]
MSSAKPRLRFAPSPTGYLHIGGVRTALFNWLWARKTGGTFILRIEDTDQERSTPENEQIILRDLSWLGLNWDEGPDVGGPNGPYRQMERLALYHSFADKLIEKGGAYRCYCTKEELDAQREAVKAKDPKGQFRYPGTCRDRKPPYPERPYVVRLKAPSSGTITYNDLVFGEVSTPNNTQQDWVLIRNDGVPLYNFGCVIDDITMGITLVARGRDHMINTPIQLILYEALGYTPPQFAHLPMMLAPDGTKLSKRHGAVAVGEYREKGLTPDGLLSYLVRFGWSFGDEEIFTKQSLVEKFDWERCSKSDGKFDFKKLAAVAFEHLKRDDLTSAKDYVDGAEKFLTKKGFANIDRNKIEEAMPMIRERAQTFIEAADALDYFFREPPTMDEKAVKKQLTADKAAHLATFRQLMANAPSFKAKELEAIVLEWLAKEGLTLKDVAQAARVAVTGRAASPGLFEVMEVLGRDICLARLDRGIEICKGSAQA